MNVCFVTWDGPEQNYMESLFLPILGEVANDEISFSALQFTWDSDTDSIGRTASELGIPYESRDVIRRPLKLATAAMIFKGAADVVKFARQHDVDVLMPRSIIPAAMVLLARKRLPDVRVVFDADGFMADERVDFSGWDPSGVVYRLFRDLESQAVRNAEAVLTRTERAREILLERAGPKTPREKIFVISNGKDEQQFRLLEANERARIRAENDVPDDAPWIVYAGSLGPQYYPTEMVRLFELIAERQPDARFLILTGQQDVGNDVVAASSLRRESVTVRRVPADDVPRYLGAADLGVALRAPSFSQRGVAPIKVGEYLLCGLPVVATSGVGDLDDQLDDTVGFVVGSTDDERLQAAADWFSETVLGEREQFRARCRAVGKEHYGLSACVAAYRDALQYAAT